MAPSLGLLALLAVTQAAPAASPPAAAVKGFVLDAESSAPLSGAGVTLADLNRSVTTDATGRYSFEGVPAGPQHLTVHRLGYNTRTLHLLVPSTGRLHFDVSLGPRPIKLAGISVSPVPTVRGQDGTGLTAWPDRGLTQASLV
ncbi:MAG TPA: carboxypeptidase regulatory-like domain-containing protein, partial [Longimicrobiales bacterium]|nr:carboxypeptidase regulatory-like domain-containing protein [Longimicrobiales bacterium]